MASTVSPSHATAERSRELIASMHAQAVQRRLEVVELRALFMNPTTKAEAEKRMFARWGRVDVRDIFDCGGLELTSSTSESDDSEDEPEEKKTPVTSASSSSSSSSAAAAVVVSAPQSSTEPPPHPLGWKPYVPTPAVMPPGVWLRGWQSVEDKEEWKRTKQPPPVKLFAVNKSKQAGADMWYVVSNVPAALLDTPPRTAKVTTSYTRATGRLFCIDWKTASMKAMVTLAPKKKNKPVVVAGDDDNEQFSVEDEYDLSVAETVVLGEDNNFWPVPEKMLASMQDPIVLLNGNQRDEFQLKVTAKRNINSIHPVTGAITFFVPMSWYREICNKAAGLVAEKQAIAFPAQKMNPGRPLPAVTARRKAAIDWLRIHREIVAATMPIVAAKLALHDKRERNIELNRANKKKMAGGGGGRGGRGGGAAGRAGLRRKISLVPSSSSESASAAAAAAGAGGEHEGDAAPSSKKTRYADECEVVDYHMQKMFARYRLGAALDIATRKSQENGTPVSVEMDRWRARQSSSLVLGGPRDVCEKNLDAMCATLKANNAELRDFILHGAFLVWNATPAAQKYMAICVENVRMGEEIDEEDEEQEEENESEKKHANMLD